MPPTTLIDIGSQTGIGIGTLGFDIIDFQSRETAPDGGNQQIVDVNENFNLCLTFKGTGTIWTLLENIPLTYRVRFYGEGIGATPDINLGVTTGTLVAGQGTYTVCAAVAIATQGVYECAATVAFYLPNGVAWTGLLGYAADLVVMVNPEEQ